MKPCEYEQPRSFPEFHTWLDGYRAAINSDPGLGHESIVRDDKIAKRLFEEAWPIRPFLKSYFPGEHGDIITLVSGSQGYDAVIHNVVGEIVHYIEVTQAISKTDHLKRRELAETGSYMSDDFTNCADDIAWLADEANRVIRKKLAKSYPSPATLIVALYDDVIFDNKEMFNAVLSGIRFPQDQRTFCAMVFTTQNLVLHRLWGFPARRFNRGAMMGATDLNVGRKK